MERKRLIFIIVIGAVVLLAGGLFALGVQQGWVKIGAEEEEETGVTEAKSGACYLIKKDSDPKCFEFCRVVEDVDRNCSEDDAVFLEGRNCTPDPNDIVLGMYPICPKLGCCIKSIWRNIRGRLESPMFMNNVGSTKNVTREVCEQYNEGGPQTTDYDGQTSALPSLPNWSKIAAWWEEKDEDGDCQHFVCNKKNICKLNEFPGTTDERCEAKPDPDPEKPPIPRKDGEQCDLESSDGNSDESPADEPAEESPDEE